MTTINYGFTAGNIIAKSAVKDLKKWLESLREGDTDGDEDVLPASLMPSRIHFNGPVTVVVWEDGSKTVVRRAKDIPDDPYTAFCAALAKKVYGNNTRVKKILHDKTYVPKKKKETADKGNSLLDWDGNPTMREDK